MNKLRIKQQYALLPNEHTILAGLPTAAHDAKYTVGQARDIRNIYYRLFGSLTGDSTPVSVAQKEKWPGNERKTELAAQRQVIDCVNTLPTFLDEPATSALLLNTMRMGKPLHILIGGLCLEAYDVPPVFLPPPPQVDFMAAFNRWAENHNLTHEQVNSFCEAINTQAGLQGLLPGIGAGSGA